ncbi:MAG: 3-deoxy-D-manno-octulosonic acid transferase [Bauldia sp.]|uniref:3-deoxy-D-manno-octulosonic acid transferase n=1 Tax=Bauldia sp. TaxID=2575872 RepID=UPI001DB6B012|nr:3-deoxy-D-manno-octulosonic acid transferase [Bauldia sp.]MCB1494552.1 3-deoxy-D-manno-octulosonic acid transferase [Bauldia sp.]
MASLSANIAFGLYRAFGSVVVRPLAPLLLSYRVSRGKEDPARLDERYGRASRSRPDGAVVWVHAASVGETNAVLPLIKEIVGSGRSVVFTTVTLTAARIAEQRLPPGAVHQFSPIDVRRWMKAFIAHWRPEMAIFVESELWPQAIATLTGERIPLVIVNGRLSRKSFEGWHRRPSIAHALFSQVNLCLAQTETDGERYRSLGVPAVTVTGNLKFDTPPPGADDGAREALAREIGNRPLWLAASTHPGEEEIVVAAHRRMVARHPGLLTIIVPRHPHRGAELVAAFAGNGLSIACRSSGQQPTPSTDIYLADTLGELGLFYRIAPVAFVGGSLVDHGGQNPIEPVVLGTAVLHGPHIQNFADVYEALDKLTAGCRVVDAGKLAESASILIADARARERCVTNAQAALSPFRGALERTMVALKPVLRSEGKPGAPLVRLEPAQS